MHRAPWPDADELRAAARLRGADVPDGADPGVFDVAAAVLGEIRKAKTAAKASMRADVARVVVRDAAKRLDALAAADRDVRDAGRVAELATEEAGAFSVEVVLA